MDCSAVLTFIDSPGMPEDTGKDKDKNNDNKDKPATPEKDKTKS